MTNYKKIIAALCLPLALCCVLPSQARAQDWGIYFPQPGQAPQANASRESLLEYDGYFIGAGDEKTVYLTFDNGYENGYTEQILDVLKKMEVPAAFFVVGPYIRDNPALVVRMAEEGHIVANHTMTHPDMSAISDLSAFKKELSRVEELYRELTGRDMPNYYRPPRGVYSVENLKMAKELGYKTIFWSLAYKDWDVKNQPGREQAFSKLVSRVHPGAVLLLHCVSKTNTELLEDLICEYRSMGYEFKSLDALCSPDGCPPPECA